MVLILKDSIQSNYFQEELKQNLYSEEIQQITEVILIAIINSLTVNERLAFISRFPEFIDFNKESTLINHKSHYTLVNLIDLAERAHQIDTNYAVSVFRNKQQALAQSIIFINILNNYMECPVLRSVLSLDIY